MTPKVAKTPAERDLRRQQRVLATELLAIAAEGDVPDAPPVSPARLLFVVGCPRSGTTWVRDILADHPATIAGRETHMYQDVFTPLVRGGRDEGWARLLLVDQKHRNRGTGGHLQAWIDREAFLSLVVRAMASEAPSLEDVAEQLIAELYDHILAVRGATADDVLVDKTPWHLRFAGRILRRFPEAKVVEVLRDGRDVCVSMEKLDRQWAPDDRATQIDRWIEAVETGLALRADAEVADRVHLVRYEDLKVDLDGQITGLLRFAGLDHSPVFVERMGAAADFSNHRHTGDGQFRRKGVVGDWTNAFSDADVALFREKVGPLFGRAGYEY
jgi:hypothetical protein